LDVGEAASVMMDKWIGSIPVVENDRLVGIITQTDALRYYPELSK
jgi:CBS domain-containing protein